MTAHEPSHATLRVAVTGRLVLGPRVDWRSWRPLADAAAGRVLALDLSGVSQVDAAGIGLLVTLAVETRRRRGRLRLMCAPPRVRTLIRTTGLGPALGLVSEAAVVRAVRRHGAAVGGGARERRESAACRH